MTSSQISLVIGGSGFVGIELVRHLVEAGRQVRVFDKNPIGDAELEKQVESVQGDIRDISAVTNAIADVHKTYNLAAMVQITRAGDQFHAVNVGGTENVINAAVEANIDHLVHLSSSAIYGVPAEIPITEDTAVDPLGEYGRSKFEGEMVVRRAIDNGL